MPGRKWLFTLALILACGVAAYGLWSPRVSPAFIRPAGLMEGSIQGGRAQVALMALQAELAREWGSEAVQIAPARLEGHGQDVFSGTAMVRMDEGDWYTVRFEVVLEPGQDRALEVRSWPLEQL